MDSTLKSTTEGGVRISDSPRRSPHITHTVTSPVRSLHPTLHMESLHSQADIADMPMDSIDSQVDLGMRTADFFDASSSDGEEDIAGILDREASGVEANLIDRGRHTQSKRRASRPQAVPNEPLATRCRSSRRSVQPEGDGYQRLSPVKIPEEVSRYVDTPDTPSTSFNGSITELLSGEHGSSPPDYPRPARISTFGRPHSTVERRSEPAYRSSSVMPPPVANKVDQILSAQAIAHEITLQSLMRDENTLDRTIDTFGPMGDRGSVIPASLRFNDPRSPGTTRKYSAPEDKEQRTPGTAKKVHVLPPPIDTTRPRGSLPQSLVRTPYPDGMRRKDLSHITEGGPDPSTPAPNVESILTLSIRPSKKTSRRRVTTIVIPAANGFSAVRSAGSTEKEHHFRSVEFDDKEFFLQVQQAYASLSGPWRFFSARSLKRIVVSGIASKAADSNYGWLHSPRSPRELAFKGLQDTFGEDKILAHYRRPAMGKSRYAFVQWAHRLAAVELRQSPHGRHDADGDLAHKIEQPEGLEFVLSWSILRLSLALLLILVASVAAALLWILLGSSTAFTNSDSYGPDDMAIQRSGFRNAGERVGAGLVMGICVLLIGLSSMAGWMGVSWLVI
jgi:hypothetical protein